MPSWPTLQTVCAFTTYPIRPTQPGAQTNNGGNAFGLLQNVGEIGRGTHYVPRGKSGINRPSWSEPNRAAIVPNVQTARARHKPAKRATAKSAINQPIRPRRRPAE
jgi:hypothetical protein